MAKKKSNPWAICTASVGRDNKEKYERCIMKVKKKTAYKEGAELSPVDQIAEMLTDHPDVIAEMRPDAQWTLGERDVPGISLRDEPWEEAMHKIASAWESGYKIMVFDDGLLMTNDTDILTPDMAGGSMFYPRSVTDALAYARHYWWTENDPQAVNHGAGQDARPPQAEPVGDQFPHLEDIERIASLTEDLGSMGMGMGGEPAVMDAPSMSSSRSVDELEAELDALLAAEMGGGPAVEPITEPEAPAVPAEPSAPTQPDPFTPTKPSVSPDPKAWY